MSQRLLIAVSFLVHFVSPLLPIAPHVCDPLQSRSATSQSQSQPWGMVCMRLALKQAEAALKASRPHPTEFGSSLCCFPEQPKRLARLINTGVQRPF